MISLSLSIRNTYASSLAALRQKKRPPHPEPDRSVRRIFLQIPDVQSRPFPNTAAFLIIFYCKERFGVPAAQSAKHLPVCAAAIRRRLTAHPRPDIRQKPCHIRSINESSLCVPGQVFHRSPEFLFIFFRGLHERTVEQVLEKILHLRA